MGGSKVKLVEAEGVILGAARENLGIDSKTRVFACIPSGFMLLFNPCVEPER